MTCIIGLIRNKKVYIGGDSAGVAGNDITIRKDSKVFKVDKFIIGYTNSFRMGQLLRFKLKVDDQERNITDYEYMCTKFIDAVRKCLKDGGYAKIYDEREEIGTFLIGYKNKLYVIFDDLQVGESYENFNAVGCGEDYAKGALDIILKSSKGYTAEKIIEKVLTTVVKFSSGVRPPFNILKG